MTSSDLRPNSPISDNIHWVKDRFVNAYIIDNGTSLSLIDTAVNKKATIVHEYILKELENKPLETIYLTHHHSDHMGGLHFLNDHYHPHVYSSETDGEIITGKRKPMRPKGLVFKLLYPFAKSFLLADPISSINVVRDQQTINNLHVYELPGHTMGSVGYLKEKTFFVGDACRINKKGDIVIGAKYFTESMTEAKESLKRLSNMHFDILFAGHGTPILQNADMRVLDAVEKLNKQK